MNTCQICNKEFKRPQDLKGHNTKIHSANQSLEIIATEPVEQISIPTIETQINTESEQSISFDISSDSDNEDPDISEQLEAFYVTRPRRANKKEVETQTEEPEQRIHSTTLKINGIFMESDTFYLDKLPEICDDISVFSGKLKLLKDNKIYDISHLALLNQYEPLAIDLENRVQQRHQEMKFKRVSYNQYISDNIEKPTFLNMRKDKQGNQLPALVAKLCNENTMICKTKTPLFAYFDFETFDTDLSFRATPLASRPTSHISMISLIYQQTAILFHLDIYSFSAQQAQKTIFEHCGKTFDIQTQQSENEKEMVLQFIMTIKNLSAYNTIVLSGFNSSNDQKGENIMGYDCSFILRNLSKQVKIEKRRCSGSGEFPTQLIQIGILPNVYFCDMMLMYDENTKAEKKSIQGMSLNSYLKFYKIPMKLDGNHEEQRPVQINGGNISIYGAYCLYDSICLQLVAEKHNIISQRLSYCEKFNLPLSMCLYATPVNMITCHLQQEFYKRGYMFSYSKIGTYTETRTKQGAMTQQCPKALQYKSLPNVHIFDFQSEYPSVGIQFNISPETYSEKYQQGFHKVQINYQKDQPEDMPESEKLFAYFDNTKVGIVSDFQRQIFAERVSVKGQLKNADSVQWQILQTKQLALKEMINSMYGAQNDSRSAIYRYQCGSAITGAGRQLLDTTIKMAETLFETKRLFADTDSLALQYEGSDVQQKFEKLQAQISVNNPNMTLELEDSYKVVMYPINLKSYAKINQKDELTIKGVAFNKFTLNYRQMLENLFRQILTNKTDKTPQDICYQYKAELLTKLHQIIQNGDVKQLEPFVNIRKTNKLVTKTGTQTLGGFLVNQYPDVHHFNTIPFNCHIRKNFCHIPIELLTSENINEVRINDLATDLLQPIKTFFKIDVPKSEIACGKVKKGQVAVRVQTTKYYSQTKVIDRDELLKLIAKNGHNTTYHEVMVNDVNKCYFDIESEKIQISAYKLTYVIQEVLQNYNVQIHIGDGCKTNKMSYHVVVDIKMNKAVNQYIASLINARLGAVCDLKVYKNNASIRLPNCVKIDANTKTIENRRIKPITGTPLLNFLISDNIDALPDYSDFISFQKMCPITDAGQSQFNVKTSAVLNLLKQHKIDATMTRGNQIDIKTKPYVCPACKDEHRSNNMFLSGDKVKCYNADCCGLLVDDKIKEEPKILPLLDAITSHTYKVKYSIKNAHHTFVKSQMGTGKTETLLSLIDDKLPVIVVISFRRTFADEFSKKMGFKNYQAVGGKDIKLSENPRICIQYESLHKLEIDCQIDLVVCDEIESILSQITAFDKRENNQNTLTLIELLRNKSLIMDALLQQSTIELISNITGIDNTQTYENTYQMQSSRKMLVDNKPTDEKIINEILADLQEGKKVSVNCCSKKLAKQIRLRAIELGKVVGLYDGDNNEVIEQFGTIKTMGSHKAQQLQNPNEYWKQLDLLIYTATISAGVSFTEKHFNLHYGILKNKSSDVIAFTQGNHRVRDLSDNVHKIFIFPLYHDFQDMTPMKISTRKNQYNCRSVYTRNNQIQQLNIYLQARTNTLRCNAKMLLLLWSKQAGYQVVQDGIYQERLVIMPEPVQQIIEVIEETKEEINQEPKEVPFFISESEFTDLPKLTKNNNFSLTHCDPLMTLKIEFVFIAGVYSKNYDEMVKIYNDQAQWEIVSNKQNIELRIQKNLAKIALSKTKQQSFTIENFPAIKQDLLDYYNQTIRTQSLVTSNLNIATDFQKVKYIETFITAIDTYIKVQNALEKPETLNDCLLTMGKDQKGATKIVNNVLETIGYKLLSEVTEKKVMVDGKRKTQRIYDYCLQTIKIADNLKQYLE